MRKTMPRMPGLPSRIQRLVELAGSFDDLAKLTDISRRALSDWARDLREPHAAQYVKLAEGCGVDPHWIRTGEGPEPVRLHEFIAPSPKTAPVSASEISKPRDLLGEVDVVALGAPSIVTLAHAWANKEGLGDPLGLVCNDATAAPRITLGDPVLAVRVTSLFEAWPLDQDGVWIVEKDGKFLLRTIAFDGPEMVLEAIGANPQKEKVSPADVKVRGRAVWVGRRL